MSAVDRAISMLGRGTYRLGTGDHDTTDEVFDCVGFALCWCYQIKRHRPGFNKGGSVSDDINTDSICEDGRRHHDLFEEVDHPELGDLLVYPSHRGGNGRVPGHASIVTGLPAEWDPSRRDWRALTVVQCHGPNGLTPAIVQSTGLTWWRHDRLWPDELRRSRLVRLVAPRSA